jgi:uncharacterized protein
MTEFTPLSSTLGGIMIGLSAVLLLLFNGRIAGVSGIAVRIFSRDFNEESLGRIAFILGLVLAPLLYAGVSGAMPTMTIQTGAIGLVVAGLLVGFGSVLGNGCTSGHGICGLSRLSKRSFVAVAVFMLTAAITVFVVRHVV